MMSLQSFTAASYNDLWLAAHEALLNARWTEARAALDALLQHHRGAAADHLPSLDTLPTPPPPTYRPVLEDRLRLWNAAVDRQRPTPPEDELIDLSALDDLED